MIIVLDTNILQEDYLLESPRFEVLLDFAKKTKSRIVVPKIVLDELVANYGRELSARSGRVRRATEQLNGLLPEIHRYAVPAIDADAAVASFRADVLAKLSVRPDEIVPLKDSYLNEAVDRAISRRAPCTDRGEEIRDALLWLTVRDLAVSTEDIVAFISHNTKQFTRNKVDLHPDLKAELAELSADLRYSHSLEEFAREHASHIAFITKDWLNVQIRPDSLIEGSRGIIESYVDHRLGERKDVDESPTGYINLVGGSLDLKEYFVYEMTDGSFRVELSYSGEVEVEYEVEREEETEYWEYDYEFDPMTGQYEYQQVPKTHAEVRARAKTMDAEFGLSVNATVENGAVTEWSAFDGWLN